MSEDGTLHLDEIAQWIDSAFGQCVPEGQPDLLEASNDERYQQYFRDQVNRQIIRDYLTNALVLGVITEAALPAFAPDLASEEGRAILSLYMLMSSVEEAQDLPLGHADVVSLKPLKPESGKTPAHQVGALIPPIWAEQSSLPHTLHKSLCLSDPKPRHRYPPIAAIRCPAQHTIEAGVTWGRPVGESPYAFLSRQAGPTLRLPDNQVLANRCYAQQLPVVLVRARQAGPPVQAPQCSKG